MPVPASSGRVFISYRRQDARGSAGRIYDRLAERFGGDQVFMDVDTIGPGVDFAKVITQAVGACQVLLAVIGPGWLTATDEGGQRRLDDSHDLVRLEIAAALERDILVIPILVEDAAMPRRQQLPENLVELAGRNAHRVRHESFGSDTDRLLAAIDPILRPPAAAPAVAPGFVEAVTAAAGSSEVVAEPTAVLTLLHDDNVNDVAFSPDGRLLATASADRTARVWEVGSGKQRTRVTHDDVVYAVAFSPDGRLLATGSYDDSARVWALVR